jgi:hypothetical protein
MGAWLSGWRLPEVKFKFKWKREFSSVNRQSWTHSERSDPLTRRRFLNKSFADEPPVTFIRRCNWSKVKCDRLTPWGELNSQDCASKCTRGHTNSCSIRLDEPLTTVRTCLCVHMAKSRCQLLLVLFALPSDFVSYAVPVDSVSTSFSVRLSGLSIGSNNCI